MAKAIAIAIVTLTVGGTLILKASVCFALLGGVCVR